MTIYFLIPTYNESSNLVELASNLKSLLDEHNKYYLFIDDNSSDNSVNLIDNLFKNEQYHIIRKPYNLGPGDSFNRGFEWILIHSKEDSDIIVTMEADNTSDPKILPDMVAISKLGDDLILASVYAQGGGLEKTTLFRKVCSFFANMIFRTIFDIKVLTISSFYRVYHVNLIRAIQQYYGEIISEKGFICMLEILIKSIRMRANIIEIPMILKSQNRRDKSKMKLYKNIMSYLNFLFIKSRKYKKGEPQ